MLKYLLSLCLAECKLHIHICADNRQHKHQFDTNYAQSFVRFLHTRTEG